MRPMPGATRAERAEDIIAADAILIVLVFIRCARDNDTLNNNANGITDGEKKGTNKAREKLSAAASALRLGSRPPLDPTPSKKNKK